jgi:hypothetical protein
VFLLPEANAVGAIQRALPGLVGKPAGPHLPASWGENLFNAVSKIGPL